MNSEGKKLFHALLESVDLSTDLGKVAAQTYMDDKARAVAALQIGVNATLQQLIKEGVFDPHQVDHFLIHLSDFSARLYAGEDVNVIPENAEYQTNRGQKIVRQTFRVDSRIGEFYWKMADLMLKYGQVESLEEGDLEDVKVFDNEEEFKQYLKSKGIDPNVVSNVSDTEAATADFDLSGLDKSQIVVPGKAKLN